MIFSGERNVIFPDNLREIIFQDGFFGKHIFSEHLEKENMAFRAVTVYDPYARICFPNKVKNLILKVHNLILGVNETRYLVHPGSCELKCGFNKNACNSLQKWYHGEYRCDCKEVNG